MMHVSYTNQARSDLHDIRDHIAADSIDDAERFVDLIKEKFQLIAETPHIGRARDDLAPLLRSFPVGNYVVLYRVLENGIEVVRVLHAARDILEFF
jgi:toxin ParE1/3/4